MIPPVAPRSFWTHRAAERWAEEQNPHLPDTRAFYEWRRDFWQDQASRSARSAFVAITVALICSVVSLLAALAHTIGY